MQPAQRPLFALALRLAAVALLSTMFLFVKLAGESGVALPEIMFWRQAVSIPILLGWLAWIGGRGPTGLGQLKTDRIATHARRAAIGMAGMVCNFGAAILLPLAEATALGFTTPLFAVVLGALIMREHVGPWRWLAVLLGFIGVLIVTQPGHAVVAPLGVAAGLGAGLMVAIVSFQIRDLARSEAPISIVFYFAAFGSALMAPMLPFFMTQHSPAQWFMLIAAGAVGTAGQILLTFSLRFGAVASVIVMDYTALIWSTLFGWLFWDQLPPAATWFGAPAIAAAGVVIAWREHKLGRRAAIEAKAQS